MNPHDDQTLLRVSDLKKYFPIYKRGILYRSVTNYVKAVDGVSFTIRRGEVLGLVGESGCGKTTTGRVILRADKPTEGSIIFHDRDLGEVDLAQMPRDRLRNIWRNIQLIFQDPYTEALLSSAPTPDPRAKRRQVRLVGEVADPANPPSGCYFHPRCQYAEERCKTELPLLRETKPGHWAACHFSEKLQLGV